MRSRSPKLYMSETLLQSTKSKVQNDLGWPWQLGQGHQHLIDIRRFCKAQNTKYKVQNDLGWPWQIGRGHQHLICLRDFYKAQNTKSKVQNDLGWPRKWTGEGKFLNWEIRKFPFWKFCHILKRDEPCLISLCYVMVHITDSTLWKSRAGLIICLLKSNIWYIYKCTEI